MGGRMQKNLASCSTLAFGEESWSRRPLRKVDLDPAWWKTAQIVFLPASRAASARRTPFRM